MPSAVQVTTAVVAVPVSSAKGRPDWLTAPMAPFQLLLGTMPATSELPMGLPVPTKSILMTRVEELEVTERLGLAEWVREPLVPVMERVEVPVGVPPVVVMVRVELPEVPMEAAEKVGEAPAGNPEAVKFTVPEKPLTGATLTVYVAVPPAMMESEGGVTVSVKSGAVTFRVTLALWDSSSVPVPVMVSTGLPPGVFVVVVTVMVEVPEAVMELGEKEAEAPEGRPVAAKVTAPL